MKSKTKITTNPDGSRSVSVSTRRGRNMENWKSGQAASEAKSLDPNSEEFREIARRYETAETDDERKS